MYRRDNANIKDGTHSSGTLFFQILDDMKNEQSQKM